MNPLDSSVRNTLALMAAGLALALPAHAQQVYALTDLGAPASTPSLLAAATGINQAGSVSGFLFDPLALTYSAFRSDAPGSMTALGTPAGFDSFYLDGISSGGDIVAGVARATSTGAFQAAYNDAVSTVVIPIPSGDSFSAAKGVNTAGTIVGHSYNTSGRFHAFTYSSGSSSILTTGASTNSDASAINSSGQIAGAADDSSGHFHAILDAGGTPVTLAGLPGSADTYAYALNDTADVVGESSGNGWSHAVLWPHGTTAPVDLGLLPGAAYGAAHAVNSADIAVGSSADASYVTFRATVWDAAGPHDLNTYLSPAAGSTWTLETATGINDAGQICGIGLENGHAHGYLLTPIPTAPTISPAAGSYVGGVTVTITDATPTASIYFTTDGDLPTVGNSDTFAYNGPFQLLSSASVTAVAVTRGDVSSSTSSAYTVTASTLQSITVTPHSLTGGAGATATITLSGPAPAGGTAVALSTDNSAVSFAVSTLTIPAGTTSAIVSLSSIPIAADKVVNLIAQAGTAKSNTHLTVLAPAVSSLSVSPSTLAGGGSTTGTIKLTGPVGAATTVSVDSSNAAASIVGPVIVPAGANQVTFAIDTVAVATNTTSSITATLNDGAQSVVMTLRAPTLTAVSFSPKTIVAGQGTNFTVTISSPAPSGGLPISVVYTNSADIYGPGSTVVVPAGATSAQVRLTANPVAYTASVVATATLNNTSKSATLTVNP